MRSRVVQVLLAVVAIAMIAAGLVLAGTDDTPSTALRPKTPVSVSGVARPVIVIAPDTCEPQPTAAVTLTVITPRTDGIFVGHDENSAIGIRFLPDGSLLFAVDIPSTSVQKLKSELTLQGVTTRPGDWEHVPYDSVGDFHLSIFGGQDYYATRDYIASRTGAGFTLVNQNNFGCPAGEVNIRSTRMSFYE